MLFILSLANLIVGVLVGISGIAGFLLPITYAGLLAMPLSSSLSLSFTSFLTSGVIGAYKYHKNGQVHLRSGIVLSIGSLIGGLIGVQLNLLIPMPIAKILLYLVVLFSGLSILLKKDATQTDDTQELSNHSLLNRIPFAILLGIVTGTICSLSGAGGPVLVMPLMVSLGMPIRLAVGTSLFNSIFIALPACIGYIAQCDLTSLWPLILASIFFQSIGVLTGAKIAGKINIKLLKRSVAFLSIGVSIYMLYSAITSLIL